MHCVDSQVALYGRPRESLVRRWPYAAYDRRVRPKVAVAICPRQRVRVSREARTGEETIGNRARRFGIDLGCHAGRTSFSWGRVWDVIERRSRHVGPPVGIVASASIVSAVEAWARGEDLIFDSNFSGSTLNTSVWATCYPWAQPTSGCTNFGNTEYQWYLPSQDQVSGGILHLAAQRLPTPRQDRNGAPKEYLCRSGMVTTYPSFHFKYGYLQVVARIPFSTGLWPALWLAAMNHWPPEIDILEHWGVSAQTTAVHFPPGSSWTAQRPPDYSQPLGWLAYIRSVLDPILPGLVH